MGCEDSAVLAGRDGSAGCWWGFVVVGKEPSVVPVSLWSAWWRRASTGTVAWCQRARASEFRISLPSPRRTQVLSARRLSWKWFTFAARECTSRRRTPRSACDMPVPGAAGLSKRLDVELDDWSDLALSEHLMAEQVTCVVMEATWDYQTRSTTCSKTSPVWR